MREPVDFTDIHEQAQKLVETIRLHQAQPYLAERITQRAHRRTGAALIITILIGAALLAALAISLTSCIPATPMGKPTPTSEAPAASPSPLPSPSPAPTFWVPTVQPGKTPTPACTVDTHGAKPGTVNVRSGPGMIYPVVDTVKDGEQMPVTGENRDGWRQVTTPRLIAGWFYTQEWCKERDQ